MKERRLLKVLYALRLRRSQVIFKGRAASVNGIVYDLKGFVSELFRRV